ncbi:hypothetical protein [Armatimonas rosea]|uniref:Uncharacterized protein n=1 Tax=Armatimonas rosea TaxID=685828 RepID=A0A7W9SUI9_ARMRO|nr:hypothetical protein [Armatimonas rosea]MBB6053066.1 hypothetical protein [Armatimonas rosea]
MHVILKPAGLLLLVGSIATLAALAVVRPIKSSVETLPELKPIEGLTTRKNRAGVFNSKTEMHPVNLTSEGKIDWVCWRSDDSHPTVRRKAGTGLFSELKLVSGQAPSMEKTKTGPSRAFIWSDGDSAAPSPVAYPGFHTDSGFAFSTKIDTAPHTLTVYVGGYKAGGDFSVTVTDGSKATVTSSDISLGEGYYSRAYKVQFRAQTPGQSVRVVWKKSRGEGNISLQAASLG